MLTASLIPSPKPLSPAPTTPTPDHQRTKTPHPSAPANEQNHGPADPEKQLKLLREVKDAIPSLDMRSHVMLLDTYWPAFVHVLQSVPVLAQAASSQQKVRKAVLEILQR